MLFDIINASFELFASVAILLHCLKVYNQKEVKGVSIPSVIFFVIWGIWNIIYYPSINQKFSFIAGILVCFTNIIYVILLIFYSKSNKNPQRL